MIRTPRARSELSHRPWTSELRPQWLDPETWSRPLLLAMAVGFVLLGAAGQDLGPADAMLGLAAGETPGPLGQVFGRWKPELWPGRVAVCALVARLAGFEQGSPGTVLWPAALAAAGIGWLLARRLRQQGGTRLGLFYGLCWFGCLGVIDHSGATGLEFLSGLATVAALDRLLERGSDWLAGIWAAAALLTGGWPSLAIILLAVIVIGRPQSGFSWRLCLPPTAGLVAWSAWVLGTASPEALAAALAWPFTRHATWWFAPTLLALGLPFAPFALLAIRPAIRSSWSDSIRLRTVAWTQVAIACLVAGTVVPGLSEAAGVPALAGITLIAAATLNSAWSLSLTGSSRRGLLVIGLVIVLIWSLIVLYSEPFCLVMVPYYRSLGIAVLALSASAIVLAWHALRCPNTRRSVVALSVLALALKVAHLGVFVPERNYQHGQGPWGRAIGQWLLPNWSIYAIHEWPHELAFAIGRPVRVIPTPQHLAYYGREGHAKHVLLLESEYEHWPEDAPHLIKVAQFEDRWGGRRILARTGGVLLSPLGFVIPGTASASP
jgi:hypothetical protein